VEEIMPTSPSSPLLFESQSVTARFIEPSGRSVEREIEIRTNPVTGRTCRIAYSRIKEKETATETLPPPPPDAADTAGCPFCLPQVHSRTPRIHPDLVSEGRLRRGKSLLFPNLFPYGSYSAVSLFDDRHFVEIGTASLQSYTDSFVNCSRYLKRVLNHDPQAIYQAITQNHLPSAGGSLVHPHLQINADRALTNHHRFFLQRSDQFYRQTGRLLFSDYLAHEKEQGARTIAATGAWEWTAAFAPEGFYEIWGVYPGATSLKDLTDTDWKDLSRGVLNVQRFYRSICRNGYNLGLLIAETPESRLELRTVIVVRSNFAPWVRNDYTGFEIILGDMTTFIAPEQTAEMARPFFHIAP
jgi:galactose-1-phosphate uridylyltransferase